MNWLEVQSSNVAAIAYDADIYMLAIRYRDGSVYICPNVSPTAFGTLATVESKGKFLASLRMSSQAIRIRKGWQDPLDVIDEDASPCCNASFKTFPPSADIAGVTCPKCGTQFVPEMIGPVRHWRIKAAFAVTQP